MNHCTPIDIKKLYILFSTYYGHKFSSMHTTSELIAVWHQEWWESLLGLDRELVFEAFHSLKKNAQWPPSYADIIHYCDEKLGLPNQYDVIRKAIAHDFAHPIVQSIYEKIGDWSFRNDSETSLMKKVKAYYPGILADFRNDRQRKALCLEHKPQEVKHDSQGSETSRDNPRGNGVRKAQDYLF